MSKNFHWRSCAALAFVCAAALSVAVLQGCANPPLSGGASVASASSPAADAAAQQQAMTTAIGKSIQLVTSARVAATQLAVNKVITWDQDDKAQAALTLIADSLNRARGVVMTDPVQAAQLLAGALSDLAAYQQTGVPK